MICVDTNILLYAVNLDSNQCSKSCHALEDLVNNAFPWAVSWSVVYEFLRVATHPNIFNRPLGCDAAWAFMAELIAQPNCALLTETSLHQETVEVCLAEVPRIRGNMLHDFHLAVLMREHGVARILTEDRDFRTFPWVRVESLQG